MPALTIESIFEAAVKIMLDEEQSITITFRQGSFSIKFPTTRRIAEFLAVPHYYVLPIFGMMEQEGLVTRAERVGIMTTEAGTRRLVAMMVARYRDRAADLLGPHIFDELLVLIESKKI